MTFGIPVEVDEMHDGMPYGRIQGQGQGHEPLKVWIPSIFKTCLRHLQWELANVRNQGQGQGHSREVDRQSPTGLIFFSGFHD